MAQERRLRIGLAVTRVSLAMFFLVWAVEKLVKPESTQEIFESFYSLQIPVAASYAIGALQVLLILAFLAGLFKTLSYGLPLIMHAISTVSSYQQLLAPYEASNHLFWAGVPVLGALIALFLLRDSDQLLTIKTARARRITKSKKGADTPAGTGS